MENRPDIYEMYKKIFERYDYNFERYGINYTIAVVKMNQTLKNIGICFEGLVRLTDEKININDEYHLIIFMKTNLEQGYQALLTLERKIIKKYNLYDIDKIFVAAIVAKKKDLTSKDMVDKVMRLIENISDDCIVATEDNI